VASAWGSTGHNTGMGRTDDTMVYAALGDSMSIDDYAGGPGRGAASLLWRNRDDDFPAWTGRDLTTHDPSARLVLLASDGATSARVAGEQLGRLRRLGVIPTLATVTMGGNDLLAAYGDPGVARRAITTVAGNGRRLLGGLRALMGPAAPIVVATVYDPSDGSGDAGRLSLPSWPEALELLAELNRALGALAEDHQALVADVHAGSSVMAWPPAIPPSRPRARPIVACGSAASRAICTRPRCGPRSTPRSATATPSEEDAA
jgi:lysophospholipase L1-like esterase